MIELRTLEAISLAWLQSPAVVSLPGGAYCVGSRTGVGFLRDRSPELLAESFRVGFHTGERQRWWLFCWIADFGGFPCKS